MAEDTWPTTKEPVAILGFSFQFGGEADSEAGFWSMITEGRSARSLVPSERFNAAAFYHPDTKRLDRLPIQYGNFVREDISAFDAPFFGIKPSEAAAMDPQSRKLLETTYRAFENAGLPVERVAGSKTCVFTGVSSDDYRLMYVKDTSLPIQHAATGMALSMLANKISWFYDLKGPSVQLDTACSASLTALHLAVRSIQSGESAMGVVAGANLYFTPESLSPLAHLNFFSPDAKCYSFDHRANGYTRGDGFGVLILKPLSNAIADGDPIRAVIRSTASNENGRTIGGITKVNFSAQKTLIESAYQDAHLDPALTRYVEAHAPGTEGDIVEASALAAVFAEHRSEHEPLYMGSVKANVGHLEGASGIASLVKVVLMLERGIIPRLTNFERLHPKIRGGEWNMAFPTQEVPWPAGIRQASVNSFGFGGANAHAVLQDARIYQASQTTPKNHRSLRSQLIVWSTADEQSNFRLEARLREHLEKVSSPLELQSIAFTLAERRSKLPWKGSAIVIPGISGGRSDFRAALKPIRSSHTPPLVLVFTGQGAAWAKMGTQFLYDESFRNSLQRFSLYMSCLGATWNVIEELEKPVRESCISSTAYSQPLCTAVQVALVDMLVSHGVQYTRCVGHSSGEIAAAYAVGAISLQSACKISYIKGGLIARHFGSQVDCGMLAVGLSDVAIAQYIDQLELQVDLLAIFVACINSPKSVTLSGKRAHLNMLKGILEADNIFVRALPVSSPYHSPMMAPVADALEAALGSLESGALRQVECEMISTVTSKPIDVEELRTGAYWSKNLVSPVLFESALRSAVETTEKPSVSAGLATFPCMLEIGPSSTLRTPITQVLTDVDGQREIRYHHVMSKETLSTDQLLHTLGQLYCLGLPVDICSANATPRYARTCCVNLPDYPFDKSKKYWHESSASKNHRFRKHARHDLLGLRVHDWNPLVPRWLNTIRLLENPWIEDHRLGGALIYPGAGMLVMAIEAAAQYVRDLGDYAISSFLLTNVSWHSALGVTTSPEGTTTEFSLIPSTERLGRTEIPRDFKFELFMCEGDAWKSVCHGHIAVQLSHPQITSGYRVELQYRKSKWLRSFHSRESLCQIPVSRHKLYRGLKKVGLDLGPTFQVFDNVRYSRQGGLAAADIRLQNWTLKGEAEHASKHYIHPTALDGVIQMLIVALSAGACREVPTVMPSSVARIWLSAHGLASPDSIRAVCHTQYLGLRHTQSEVIAGDTSSDLIKVVVEGLQAATIETASQHTALAETITAFKIQWQPCHKSHTFSNTPDEHTVILISILDDDPTDDLVRLALSLQRTFSAVGLSQVAYISWPDLIGRISAGHSSLPHLILLYPSKPWPASNITGVFLAFKSVIPLVRGILWVTLSDSHETKEMPICHEAIVGLVRTLRNEYRRVRLITLAVAGSGMRRRLELAILAAFQPTNLCEGKPYESEYKYDKVDGLDTLQIPRVVYSIKDVQSLNGQTQTSELVTRSFGHPNSVPLRVAVTSPGLLDTLSLVPDAGTNGLQSDQVRILPAYVGLNFLDVLTALGRIPQNSVLGIEAAGFVTEAGPQSDLQPGDHVAVLTDGTLQSQITAQYQTAIKLPPGISLRDAASIAGVGCTVYRSLVDVARLEPGESILIHAGAGATGQVAIQLAQHLRAHVFVTVGSEKKRQLLQTEYGIDSSHIFNSRDASFILAVQRLTGSKGVDVVLNSLAGDLLTTAWSQIVAPFGRWVEIGKRDIIDDTSLRMRPFLNNVSFSCIDLTGIWRDRPALMRRLLTDVFGLFANNVLRPPCPLSEFNVGCIQDAFRHLQSSQDGGKVVINMDPAQVIEAQVMVSPPWNFSPDRSYLLVGGFGGIGKAVARWMGRRGAKFLIILSKTAAKDRAARAALLDDLQDAGCNAMSIVCDVAEADSLKDALAECKAKMPPIAGCIQASMVLKDRYFSEMTVQDWESSTNPKIEGTMNLDSMLPEKLEFFVMLSSLVAVAGAVGQGNYAAGCSFQSAVARSRIARGEKAVALDLGMIVDAGAVAEDENLARTMDSFGHYQHMTVHHLEQLLERYCDPLIPLQSEENCKVVCGIRLPATLRRRGLVEADWFRLPMFESLHNLDDEVVAKAESKTSEDNNLEAFASASSKGEAIAIVTEALVHKIANSLNVARADIETDRPIHFYGVDSLIATELRNWFANKCGADVPVLHILGNNSAEALAAIVVEASSLTSRLPDI